ncbi:hypothetical protein AAVH_21345 [Aphelenchoides avenae]|nr:hypothetical protein AAVH_21345 [Aphelenchus avenae]
MYQQGGTDAAAAPLRCQSKDGSFLPSATICTDKLGTDVCKQIFEPAAPAPTNGTSNGKRKKRQTTPTGNDKRPEKCDIPELTDYARQCGEDLQDLLRDRRTRM